MRLRPLLAAATAAAAAAALLLACDTPVPPGATPCVRDSDCGYQLHWHCEGGGSFTQGYCARNHPPISCSRDCGPSGYCDDFEGVCRLLWTAAFLEPDGGEVFDGGFTVRAVALGSGVRVDGGVTLPPASLWVGNADGGTPESRALQELPQVGDSGTYAGTYVPHESGDHVLYLDVAGFPPFTNTRTVTVALP